jgi:hypothetical protein
MTENDDKEAIKKVIMDYYHEGHVKADPALYEKVLHKEWRFFHHDDHGQMKTVDKAEYYSWYDPEKVDTTLKWKTTFYYVDVTKGKIGSAKIKIGNQNVQYIDYFNLMKINDTWWIVNKISTKE